jgi:hypothetical protein
MIVTRGLLAFALCLPLAVGAQGQSAQTPYASHERLSASLDSLARARAQVVQVSTIATSPGGRRVHLVRMGAGANVDARPAILLLANAHGPHLVGSTVALRTVRDLAAAYGTDTAVTRLLDRVTVYVVPRVNPDAAEQYFRTPRYERVRNDATIATGSDVHRPQDGPADVNGDGVVTMMRIADPRGEWMPDETDPFLLRRADARRGESGRYRLLVEGRDRNGDGMIAADQPTGIDVGRNFSNDFTHFRGGGNYPFESDEAKAIADLFQTKPGIVAVYVLGPQDNLMRPWEARRVPGIGGNPQGTSAGGPLTAMLPDDGPWLTEVARRHRETLGLTRQPVSANADGDPLSWAYYHMGRFAFGSRAWWIPEAPADTARGRRAPSPDPIAEERNAYRWLRANAPDAIVEWSAVQHPDFPGRTVEVGGIKPFATLLPPAAQLDAIGARHVTFVKELAGMLPQLAVREVRVEQVQARVFRITAQVANTGFLPTNAAIGVNVRWPRRVRVDLVTTGAQSLASGRAMQLISAVPGSGGSTELSWLVVGAPGSSVTLKAETPMAGSVRETITLRAR